MTWQLNRTTSKCSLERKVNRYKRSAYRIQERAKRLEALEMRACLCLIDLKPVFLPTERSEGGKKTATNDCGDSQREAFKVLNVLLIQR